MVVMVVSKLHTVVPLLKDSLERTPLYKGHKFLVASTVNVCGVPSHQRTPQISTQLFGRRRVLIGGRLL